MFHIQRVDLSGATVMGPALRALLGPYHDRDVSLDELQALAASITTAYHRAGYLLAQAYVPSQTFDSGVVRLDVLEGRVGDVTVVGNRHYSTKFIRWLFGPAVREVPLRESTLVRALLLMNEMLEFKVTSVFKAGRLPGTSDVTLRVEDGSPQFLQVDYNDYGTATIGEHRAGLGYINGNLTGQGDLLFGEVMYAFPSRLKRPLVQAVYAHPVTDDGTTVSAAYANSNVRVGGDFSVLDVRGNVEIYGVNVSHALRRTLADAQELTVSLQSKSSTNTIAGNPNGHDEIREVAVAFTDQQTIGEVRYSVNVAVTQGLGHAFGGSPSGDLAVSRPGASDNFTRVNIDGLRIEKLGGVFLVVRVGGQVATRPLLIQEQYGLGGPDSVRGYAVSEILGDNGYVVSTEVRIPLGRNSPTMAELFVDHGGVSQNVSQAGVRSAATLTGAGIGLRTTWGRRTDLRLELGFPLAPSPNTSHRAVMIYGQATSRFQL